jgi:hypothetical protein
MDSRIYARLNSSYFYAFSMTLKILRMNRTYVLIFSAILGLDSQM